MPGEVSASQASKRNPETNRVPQLPSIQSVVEEPVGGRLSKYLPVWQTLTSDRWVLEIIESGYALEFEIFPKFRGVRETKVSNHSDLQILMEEVNSLLSKNCIEKVPLDQEQAGFYSTFFLVPKKPTGRRPILNLKPINGFFPKKHFKMESLRLVKQAVNPGDWLVAIDLSDAYMHIPIREAHRKFLRFKINGQAFQFKVLPFGLATAPRVFTKV